MASVTKLFDEAEIAQRVRDLASDIAAAISGEVMMVGLLKGSFVFMADLIRALDAAGLSPRIGFMTLSSYGPSWSTTSWIPDGPSPSPSPSCAIKASPGSGRAPWWTNRAAARSSFAPTSWASRSQTCSWWATASTTPKLPYIGAID
jgi:hypothetical protein